MVNKVVYKSEVDISSPVYSEATLDMGFERQRKSNLGEVGRLSTIVGFDVLHGHELTVIQLRLVQRSTTRRRNEATFRVVGVIVPQTVLVVLWSLGAAARKLHKPSSLLEQRSI